MKTCGKCELNLSYDDFCVKNHTKDGYSYYCRECSSKQAKKYYKNTPSVKAKTIKRNKKFLLEKKVYVYNYLLNHPCACGEARPECLDFDHQHNKIMNVSTMISKNWGLNTIKSEIEKCVVLCSNCHRAKTAKDFNWYNSILGETRTLIKPL